ncbi:family 10 glycosylhydrolase [Candidatus Sumerlaeota bacterium]|nr:family 10 glycosylhydrolase [Candidatus Sumerlaeota bacterium]
MRNSVRIILSVFLGLNLICISIAGEPSILRETRGVWVDKSDVHKGKKYLTEMLDRITAANFNAIYVATLYKGYVIYPESKYLPQDPEVKKFEIEIYGTVAKLEEKKIDRSMIKWIIDEAHKRHLFVEAWPEYGFYSYHTPNAKADKSRGVLLDKHPELTAIDINGQPYLHNPKWGDFYSLCPSNPESHEILINILVETITRYNFDGLNLDRIRYPTKDFCFCAYCKEHFKQDTGFELTKANLQKSEVQRAFYEWRKTQLNQFMEKLYKRVRQVRPDILISADVWVPEQIDEKGQDWPTWLNKGYIDVVIPMMYWANIEGSVNASLRLVSDSHRLLCGISAEVNSSQALAEQIHLARKKKTGGVVIWYLGKVGDDLEFLKSSVFKYPARPFTSIAKQKSAISKKR